MLLMILSKESDNISPEEYLKYLLNIQNKKELIDKKKTLVRARITKN